VPTQGLRERMGAEAFERALQAAKRTSDCASGAEMVVLPGPPVSVIGFTLTRQPEQMLEDTRAALELQPAILASFGLGPLMNVSTRSEDVGATRATVCEVSFSVDDKQAQRAIEALYGKTMTTYLAAGPDGLVSVTGPAESSRRQLERLLARQEPLLAENPRVKAALNVLSPQPAAVMLVDVGTLLRFAVDLTREVEGQAPQFSLPAGPLPLVSCGVYLQGRQIRGEMVVPAEAVAAVVGAVRSSQEKAGRGLDIRIQVGAEPASRPGGSEDE